MRAIKWYNNYMAKINHKQVANCSTFFGFYNCTFNGHSSQNKTIHESSIIN